MFTLCPWEGRPCSAEWAQWKGRWHSHSRAWDVYWSNHPESVSHSVVSDSYVTPWTVAHQAPLSMGFSRQEHWSRLPFPSPGDLPDPEMELRSPALQVDSLPSQPPGLLTCWDTSKFPTYLGYAAAAKSLQSCPTLHDPIDRSPPGSPISGILQARTLEWVAISFSSA